MSETYRIDHYYSLQADGEFEEGHIFCTPEEGEEIALELKSSLPLHVLVVLEPGGEYDYTTEGGITATMIAQSIAASSGFGDEDDR